MFLVHPQCWALLRVLSFESSFGKGLVETAQGCVWAELGLQEDPCAPGGREAVLPWQEQSMSLCSAPASCPAWRWSQAVRQGQSSSGGSQAPQRSQSSFTGR